MQLGTTFFSLPPPPPRLPLLDKIALVDVIRVAKALMRETQLVKYSSKPSAVELNSEASGRSSSLCDALTLAKVKMKEFPKEWWRS